MLRPVLVVVSFVALMCPAHAEEKRWLVGTIVSVITAGPKQALVINRGGPHGVEVGRSWTCMGARSYRCEVTEVYELRSKCIAHIEYAALFPLGACGMELPARPPEGTP